MPRSRKRHTHHRASQPHNPARRKNKARVYFAILLGIFGLIIAYAASSGGYIALLLGAAAGAVIGYYIGKRLERIENR